MKNIDNALVWMAKNHMKVIEEFSSWCIAAAMIYMVVIFIRYLLS